MDAWDSGSEKRIEYVRETESRALQFAAVLAVALANAEVSRSREAGYLFDDDAYSLLQRIAYRSTRTIYERQPQEDEGMYSSLRGGPAHQARILAELDQLVQARRDIEESLDSLTLGTRYLTTQERSKRARAYVEVARKSLNLFVNLMIEDARNDDSSKLLNDEALSLLLVTDMRLGRSLTEYEVTLTDEQYQYVRRQLGEHGLAQLLPPRIPTEPSVMRGPSGEEFRPVRLQDPLAQEIAELERSLQELEAENPTDDLATIEQAVRARIKESLDSLSESILELRELEVALGAYAPLLLEPWDRQQKGPLQEALRAAQSYEPTLYERLWTLLGRESITAPALRMDLYRTIEEWLTESVKRKQRLQKEKDLRIQQLATADVIAREHLARQAEHHASLITAQRARLAQLKQQRAAKLQAEERDRQARLKEEELLLQRRAMQLKSDLEHELDSRRWRVLTKRAFQRARDRICPVYPLC